MPEEPDEQSIQSDTANANGRTDFDLRTERSDTAFGSSHTERTNSVHDTILRHHKQARRFAEHAARSPDEQNDKAPESARESLSNDHSPRSLPDRSGRLRHGEQNDAPKDARRGKTKSPYAAKYEPPDTPAAPAGTAEESPAPDTEADASEPARDSDARPDWSRPDHGNKTSRSKKPGKLKFSGDEAGLSPTPVSESGSPPDAKLKKTMSKAEHSAIKLEKAKNNLPTKRTVKLSETSSGRRKLHFEETVKTQYEHLKGPAVTRPVKAGAKAVVMQAHRKIYQVEHENVGTEAAHRGEMLAESGLRGLYRHHKSAPYRKVERLGNKTTKLNMRASYQKAMQDSPNRGLMSRMAQKRKIKKQYAKAKREAERAGKAAKKTAVTTEKIATKVVNAVRKHPVMFGIIAAMFLIVVIISSLFTSCSSIASSLGVAVAATSYIAEDADIDNAELLYTEMETDLLLRISDTENEFPGFDEYRYQVDNVGHNPYELMAYLTVMYQEFRFSDIEAALRQLFDEQYTLTITETPETRYSDPEDANGDGDLGAYTWNVLTVKLTSRSLTDVVSSHMNADQLSQYSMLMQSKGGRQYVESPFDFNWLPHVTSYYGYRIHPTTGAKDYHMGIDIGVPTGTDIHAGIAGTVTTGYDDGGYGHYITVTGADGLVVKYAHCDSLLASDGQTVNAGDIIAKSGNSGSSTGPHLHFEIIKNGQYLNPIYFSMTNDDGVSGPIYGYPGEPMGDGSYAALIAEAEKYLGYPYVWGGKSPATSFDCSGFVCWVLNQSGVANVGSIGAQKLYNISTPVSPADAMPGDLIFFTETYSAPLPVTHVGIYVGNGMMIHCGNPIQYANITLPYWQRHFYSYGRLSG